MCGAVESATFAVNRLFRRILERIRGDCMAKRKKKINPVDLTNGDLIEALRAVSAGDDFIAIRLLAESVARILEEQGAND